MSTKGERRKPEVISGVRVGALSREPRSLAISEEILPGGFALAVDQRTLPFRTRTWAEFSQGF